MMDCESHKRTHRCLGTDLVAISGMEFGGCRYRSKADGGIWEPGLSVAGRSRSKYLSSLWRKARGCIQVVLAVGS